MSTSGPGVFDDDLAWDVREIYRRMLQDRMPDDEATRGAIAAWPDQSDEVPVLWLALAAAQSRLRRFEPEVRDRALAVIDSGEDLTRWQARDAQAPPAGA